MKELIAQAFARKLSFPLSTSDPKVGATCELRRTMLVPIMQQHARHVR